MVFTIMASSVLFLFFLFLFGLCHNFGVQFIPFYTLYTPREKCVQHLLLEDANYYLENDDSRNISQVGVVKNCVIFPQII